MSKEEEEEKEVTKEVINKIISTNYELALKTYGEDNIHLLYFLSTTLTNKIAVGAVDSPASMNPIIKQMRLIITKFHGNDPRALFNQLFF